MFPEKLIELTHSQLYFLETDIYRKIRASLKSLRAYTINLMEGVTS